MSDPIDGESFLKIVRPALETADAGKLAQLVGTHWRPEQLRYMLRSDNVDVRRVAAVTLAGWPPTGVRHRPPGSGKR